MHGSGTVAILAIGWLTKMSHPSLGCESLRWCLCSPTVLTLGSVVMSPRYIIIHYAVWDSWDQCVRDYELPLLQCIYTIADVNNTTYNFE